MYISIHVGVRMIQKQKSPRNRKANMYKTCLKEDLKNEPRMDRGKENPRKRNAESDENRSPEAPKIQKMKVRRGSRDNFFIFRPMY